LRLPGVVTTFAAYRNAVDAGGALLTAPAGALTEAQARGLIGRTWELSLDLLDTRGLPQARTLLRLLATFADAPIPTMLLDWTVLADSPLFPGLDPDSLRRLLRALTGLGLVGLDPAAADTAVLRLHPLIRDTSRLHLHTAGHQGDYLALAVRLLDASAPADPEDPGPWPTGPTPRPEAGHRPPAHATPTWRTLTPHAVHLLTAAIQTPDTDADLIDTAADIAGRVSWYLGTAGLHTDARDQFAVLLRILEQIHSPDHPRLLSTRYSLAAWTGMAGEPVAARDQLAALLPVIERTLGPDHPHTLATRHDLARWTRKADRP
ncbi:MAG TPA: tetratricopeptide repeat protein, partial [Micromonospora sp.]